jgi:hypothetical protein
MQITLSKEEQDVLYEFKGDLISIKQKLIAGLIALLLWSGKMLLNQLASYKEFSMSNIRKKGLKNVLMDRALRFFNLELKEVGGKKHSKLSAKDQLKKYFASKVMGKTNKGKQLSFRTKRSLKSRLKFTFKVILFPLFLLLSLLFYNKKKEKIKKNVIKYS